MNPSVTVLRSLASRLLCRAQTPSRPSSLHRNHTAAAPFSAISSGSIGGQSGNSQITAGVPLQDMPYVHFHKRERPKPKFRSPRKRASKLFDELNKEAVQINTERNPDVLKVPFRVGDAIEITMVSQGGVHSRELEKIRGVVLGKVNRGLGTSVYLRDVVFGEPIDRKIPLHSPLLKSLRVIEENFVFKGKRKVKRAKLYYLRDRPPIETRVTKW